MSRGLIILGVFLFLCGQQAGAQSGSLRMGIQSPTASSLGKYGEIPVQMYTGIPDIRVPIYQIDTGRLQVPIELKYHASGIKVEERAGWVGLGWVLEAGGAISRSVIGLPDEEGNGYYHTGHLLFQDNNWTEPDHSFLNLLVSEQVDTEPDYFYYSMAGRSGRFVMGPRNITGQGIRTIPYRKIDIIPDITSMGTRWILRTPDGTEYVFGSHQGYGASERITEYNETYPAGSIPAKLGDSYISAWYLAEIRSPHGNDKIQFEYEMDETVHPHRAYEEVFDFRSWAITPCVPSHSWVKGENHASVPRLKRIVWADGIIEFHANTLREDALSPSGNKQEYQLDEIRILSRNGVLREKHEFRYGYFPGIKRLRLDSVQKSGSDGKKVPPYRFSYNPRPLPHPYLSNSIDHWGYYNGADNKTLIPELASPAFLEPGSGQENFTGIVLEGADRDPDPEEVKIGVLASIQYPLGGKTEFEFEINSYGSVSGDTGLTAPGEVQTQSLRSSAEQFKSSSFEISDTPNGEPVLATLNVSLSPEDCVDKIGCPYVSIKQQTENDDGFSRAYTQPAYERVALEPGSYSMTVLADVDQFAGISVSWQDIISVKEKPASGLRIKSIKNYASAGDLQPVSRFYRYTTRSNPSDPNRSSGVLTREPRYHYWYEGAGCQYLSRSSVSKRPLGSTNGGIVGYKEVTVLHGDSEGKLGIESHHFRTAELAPDYNFPALWPFGRETSQDWKRGQKISTRLLNHQKKALQEQDMAYAFSTDGGAGSTYRGLSLQSVNSELEVYNRYEIISGWPRQSKETNEVLSRSGDRVRTEVYYHFENVSHLQLTRKEEVNFDGTRRRTLYRYAHEVGDDGEGNDYRHMKGLNMLSQPFSVTVTDGDGRVLSKEWTFWKQFDIEGHSYWLPASSWQWTGGNPYESKVPE